MVRRSCRSFLQHKSGETAAGAALLTIKGSSLGPPHCRFRYRSIAIGRPGAFYDRRRHKKSHRQGQGRVHQLLRVEQVFQTARTLTHNHIYDPMRNMSHCLPQISLYVTTKTKHHNYLPTFSFLAARYLRHNINGRGGNYLREREREIERERSPLCIVDSSSSKQASHRPS